LPHSRVGVVLWNGAPDQRDAVLAIGADFCVTAMDQALLAVAEDAPPRALPPPVSRVRRPVARRPALAA
jgi:hypothetical protein